MNIIFKHTVRNTLGNIRRTLLIVFCVIICAFVAMTSLDMSRSMENLIRDFQSQIMGSSDLYINDITFDKSVLASPDFPENKSLEMSVNMESYSRLIDGQYSILEQVDVAVYGINIDDAVHLGMIDDGLSVSDGQVVINYTVAEAFNLEIGDTIVLHRGDDNTSELQISDIAHINKGLMTGYSMIITPETFVSAYGRLNSSVIMVDVLDDSEAPEAKEYLDSHYPDLSYTYMYEDESAEEASFELKIIFGLLFAICLMMVIFVTVSVSNGIINERMSVIGTLRSLGFSVRLTTAVLLMENAFYGFVGGVIGVIIYCLARNPILNSLLVVQGPATQFVTIDLGSVSIPCCIGVILGSMAVLLLCSLNKVRKATGVAVRDIIFMNKDTAYTVNKKSVIAGLIILAAGIVCLIIGGEVASIISLITIELSLALLSPVIIRYVAGIFGRSSNPLIRLAATESYTRKSTVNSSVLISTVAALSIVLFSVTLAAMKDMKNYAVSDADVTISVMNTEAYFSYIEDLPEVTGVEYGYTSFDTVRINSINGEDVENPEKRDMGVYAGPYEGQEIWYDYYFEECPEHIGDNQIVVSDIFARKIGLNDGDVVDITFCADRYYSPEMVMEVVISHKSKMSDGAVISYESFGRIYSIENSLSDIFIKSSDPDKTFATIMKYSGQNIFTEANSSNTRAGFIREYDRQSSTLIAVLVGIIAVGLLASFVGVAGNQLIGFDGRRRELAVLRSTSMTHKQLAGMLMLESFISALVTLVAAIPAALCMVYNISRFFRGLGSTLEIKFYWGAILLLLLGMLTVFTLTVLFPIRKAKKMNLAEQLKWE